MSCTAKKFGEDTYPLLQTSSPLGEKKISGKIFAPPGVLDGGTSQHFYKRLNAPKSARIDRRGDSKRHRVAKIGKKHCIFFC